MGDNFKNLSFVSTGHFLKRPIQEISYLSIYFENNIEPILNKLLIHFFFIYKDYGLNKFQSWQRMVFLLMEGNLHINFFLF